MKQYIYWIILYYLRFWAKTALAIHKPQVIGIAGSVGKSSTRNALFAALKDTTAIMMIPGNSETGIPLGILGLPHESYSVASWAVALLKAPFGIMHIKNARYLIVEMGIDEPFPPKNMTYLLSIVKPDIAVSLNISPTHTMQFEAVLPDKNLSDLEKREFLLQKLAEEDTKIITASKCTTALYNKDDFYIDHIMSSYLQKISSKESIYTFGKGKTNTISYKNYHVSEKGTEFFYDLSIKDHVQSVTVLFSSMLLPQSYQSVFAVSLLIGSILSIPIQKIVQSLQQNYSLPKSRGSILTGLHHCTIIDSTYNASTAATIPLFDLIKTLKNQTKKKAILLFGDMRELGGLSQEEHEHVAKLIPAVFDEAHLTGPLTKQYMLPILSKTGIPTIWHKNSRELGSYVSHNMPENAFILAKGSQNTIYLEEAVKQILENKKDSDKLCRQSSFWLKKKEQFFSRT